MFISGISGTDQQSTKSPAIFFPASPAFLTAKEFATHPIIGTLESQLEAGVEVIKL